jgi:hypothetical protein
MQKSFQHDQPASWVRYLKGFPFQFRLNAWVFWITFALSYLISRPLTIATLGAYRAGAVVLILSAWLFLSRRALINRQLIFGVVTLSSMILLSAVINGSTPLQFLSFLRIPITAYLVYFLAAAYLTNRRRVLKVLRIMVIVGVVQLPVLILQRLSYPFLPARLKFGSLTGQLAAIDFGMGTFNGDAVMSFFLISLLILILFWKGSREFVKRKWLVAIWMTLTILVGNSQIQHLIVAGIWALFFLLHLRLKTIVTVVVGVVVLASALTYFDQQGILTVSPVKHTLARASFVFSASERQERIENFLNGKQARYGAIFYYLEEPVNWIGDGPGRYLNSITRERTRNWGHVFTFYSEVGLIGLFLSLLIFFLIAFPIKIKKSVFRLRISWVQTLIFLSIITLTMARYPMNTLGMIFTYCVVLISYQLLAEPKYLRLA